MASLAPALTCALVALLFYTALGLPIAQRVLDKPLALPLAPVLGWAIHSSVTLLVFLVLPFSAAAIVAVALVSLCISFAFSRPTFMIFGLSRTFTDQGDGAGNGAQIPRWAYAVAALLALTSAAAILPKSVGDGIWLADQMFDHAKIAIINDMVRLGVPPGNPFFAHPGGGDRLAYYYLYFFSAAQFAQVLGIDGWNADVAMTFFASFTSLCVMMALAVNVSGRRMAALWVVAVASCSSWRTSFEWLFSVDTMEQWLPAPGGFGGWLFQAGWVPQHLLACSCVIVAVLVMSRLADERNVLNVVVLGLVCAAGFESSTWIGGITFAVACVAIVPVILWLSNAKHRQHVLLALAIAGGLAILVAWPFIMDQALATSHRQSHAPIAVGGFDVLGPGFDASIRSVLDVPAFWFVLLPFELSAVYLGAAAVLFKSLPFRHLAPAIRRRVMVLAGLAVMALLVSWLLGSTLAQNNDLSWRAVLLASTVMIIFAAVGLTVWSEQGAWLPLALMLGAMALGLPETVRQISANLMAHEEPDAKQFAQQPALWQAVSKATSSTDRVANNPYAFSQMTPWPVNISWALLARRRSCYAGWELTQVYTSVPHDELYLIDALFERVFKGEGTGDDVRLLATTYDCSTAVLTPQDGAWKKDPFATSPFYTLVDQSPDAWRIYRRSADAGSH